MYVQFPKSIQYNLCYHAFARKRFSAMHVFVLIYLYTNHRIVIDQYRHFTSHSRHREATNLYHRSGSQDIRTNHNIFTYTQRKAQLKTSSRSKHCA